MKAIWEGFCCYLSRSIGLKFWFHITNTGVRDNFFNEILILERRRGKGILEVGGDFEVEGVLTASIKDWGEAIGLKDPKAGILDGEGRSGSLLGSLRTVNLFSWDTEELGVLFLAGDGGKWCIFIGIISLGSWFGCHIVFFLIGILRLRNLVGNLITFNEFNIEIKKL